MFSMVLFYYQRTENDIWVTFNVPLFSDFLGSTKDIIFTRKISKRQIQGCSFKRHVLLETLLYSQKWNFFESFWNPVLFTFIWQHVTSWRFQPILILYISPTLSIYLYNAMDIVSVYWTIILEFKYSRNFCFILKAMTFGGCF